MRLLFDQNLSRRLPEQLTDCFSGSLHVSDLGLTRADDERIWRVAGAQDFVLVSKDSDFYYRSLLRGFPPKFIYLRLGNCGTRAVVEILEKNISLIRAFSENVDEAVLILG